MRRITLFFASAILIVLASNAWAQECTTTCDEYDEGTCVVERQHCEYKPPPPAYGAIAYGRKSQSWGDSYNWDSQSKAEDVALSNCRAHGDDCEVMVWFQRMCGAVVSGKGTKAYWAIGDGIGVARGNALGKCAKDGGGKACTVQHATCSR